MIHLPPRHPRILFISAKHYLMAELMAGCQALDIEHRYLFLGEVSSAAELEGGLRAEVEGFRPDFLLTMNHLGLDREGLVSDFCRHHDLPLLSWFVDRPDLFLAHYNKLDNPGIAYAVWDADAVKPLVDAGYQPAFHLPLAADPGRMQSASNGHIYRNVAFVGNSMQSAVEKCWELTGQPVLSRSFWDDAAGRFAVGKFRNAADFLAQDASRARALYEACDRLAALALESFLYWRATQVYRLECVKALLPFSPVVAGDKHWSAMLGEGGWSWAGPLNYYSDLPGFYSSTRMNFNTTSLQMRGAMNQRVFDVPAAGGFLLTDYASQLEEAFVPGHEVVCYHHPCEIAELVRYFLSRPDHCRKITTRARERIMRQHTYAHRVRTMCAFMHQTYGTPACAS